MMIRAVTSTPLVKLSCISLEYPISFRSRGLRCVVPKATGQTLIRAMTSTHLVNLSCILLKYPISFRSRGLRCVVPKATGQT